MPELLTPEIFRTIVAESEAGLYVVDLERRIQEPRKKSTAT
jgi:hypothetical protein